MLSDEKLLKEYDISGIRRERRYTQEKRSELLCTIIEKNPGIRHNHILRLVAILNGMAKRTAENELKNLEKIFQVTQQGYNYKFYELKLKDTEKEMLKLILFFLVDIEMVIDKLQLKYQKLPFFKRTKTVAQLLHYLNSFYPTFTLIEKTLPHSQFKKQKANFKKLIQRLYNISKDDYDFVLMNSFLVMKDDHKLEDELNLMLNEL